MEHCLKGTVWLIHGHSTKTDGIADFYNWQVFCLKLKEKQLCQLGPIL
jgi:hypothetical protein